MRFYAVPKNASMNVHNSYSGLVQAIIQTIVVLGLPSILHDLTNKKTLISSHKQGGK